MLDTQTGIRREDTRVGSSFDQALRRVAHRASSFDERASREHARSRRSRQSHHAQRYATLQAKLLPLPGSPADPEGDPGTVDSLSGMLALPQSFGDIYLGETFTCYISLCNTSPMALAKVGLKVEVQTQLQRETLPSSDGADAPWHRAWHRASAAGGPSGGGSLPRRALSWPPLRSPAAGAPRP